ncbi:MAG: LCP family protein [Eubacteriales bacterium]|nr:LCP family protein [Eubacteriales bacterium]
MALSERNKPDQRNYRDGRGYPAGDSSDGRRSGGAGVRRDGRFGTAEASPEDEEDYRAYARSRDRDRQARGAAEKTPRDSGGDSGQPGAGGQKGRAAGNGGRRRAGAGRIALRIFLAMLLIMAVTVGYFLFKMRSILRIQRMNSVDLEEQLTEGISSKVRNNERMQGYRNIALFGVDSRSGELLDGNNRSDTIMICSIQEETGEIRLVSVYRDTFLNVGDDIYTKANAAYAYGGPAQAIDMLNRNLDLNIVDFVTVGFEGLIHTIDALGGIEIELDEEERGYLNMYVHDMHLELGTDDTPVEETGLVSVTGTQATAYSRIRYTQGDDFKRAERQRIVLNKTLEKAKAASPATLVDVANSVAGDLATSLSSGEILNLITKATSLNVAETGGIPQEEYRGFGSTYEDGDFILPQTLEDNVKWLHLFLFGEEDYKLSEEAAEIDAYLRENRWQH